MAMNASQDVGSRELAEVNTTPLIDVMLVLLVMLIMTLPVQTHGVKVQSSNAPISAPLPPSIYIDIDPDGTIVWHNQPLSGIDALETLFREESRKEPQAQIQLRPSGLASYDVIANVMACAQRNNMSRLGFINVAEFAD